MQLRQASPAIPRRTYFILGKWFVTCWGIPIMYVINNKIKNNTYIFIFAINSEWIVYAYLFMIMIFDRLSRRKEVPLIWVICLRQHHYFPLIEQNLIGSLWYFYCFRLSFDRLSCQSIGVITFYFYFCNSHLDTCVILCI